MSYTIVIPARYNSQRLKEKILRNINGKALIQHTYENAKKSQAKSIIVATDDKRIQKVCQSFGADVCMTSSKHNSGTERIGEVVKKLAINAQETIVNIQGDEPLIPADVINELVTIFKNSKCDMATVCQKIIGESSYDTNCVKVVFDKNNKALYFSRLPIPFVRDGKMNKNCYKHIGIYVYNVFFLKKYLKLPNSKLELSEKLEQLGVLWHGFSIEVMPTNKFLGYGVDTQEDLQQIKEYL